MTQELTKKAQEMIKELNKSQKDWDNFSEGNYPIIQTRISQARDDWTNELAKANKLYTHCLNLIQGSGVELYGLELEIMEWIHDLQNALEVLNGK